MIALGCSTHRERPVQKTSNGGGEKTHSVV